MKYAIVYSSKTGNTAALADRLHDILPHEHCVYFGDTSHYSPELGADLIFAGFWTDKGSCDESIAQFLKTLTNQKVFLFGTAGFGGSPEYFEQILKRVSENLGENTQLVGSYMCQGKMPPSVRARYEAMRTLPAPPENLDALIENFDRARSHPDADDLDRLRAAVLHA